MITGKPLEKEEWREGVLFNFSVLTKKILRHLVTPSARNLTFVEIGRYLEETQF
jgi:hypothetical protein